MSFHKEVPMKKHTLTFTIDKETKNTVKYAEDVPESEANLIALYLRKSLLGEAPYPTTITVTIGA
jgi:hypothetical protein